jgi:predicted phosphoadenosine phosphosulfate sulfurtransferase
MNISVKNLSRPSNKAWKKVADFFLYTLPLYLGVIVALPLPEETKIWINFGMSMAVVTLKGLTKFTSEETINTTPNVDTDQE